MKSQKFKALESLIDTQKKRIKEMSEFKEMEKAIQEKTEELNKFVEKQYDEIRVKFIEVLSAIFLEYPKLISFSWIQGTPSWCDGEPCSFNVYMVDEELEYEGFDSEVHESYVDDGHVITDWKTRTKRKAEPIEIEYNEMREIIEDLIESIPESVLETLYGDGTKVTITREGIETDDHDMD